MSVLQIAALPVPPAYEPPGSFSIERRFEAADLDTWLRDHGGEVRALVTHSLRGMPDPLWSKLPSLELIANFGAGLDAIDLREAARRGVRVTYTPDAMTHDVADLAFTHLLALYRRLVAADAYLRAGSWGKQPFGTGRSTQGRRLGILGLGRIGSAIARRAQAFDMPVGYHSRRKSDATYTWFPTLLELARWADVLIAAVPGGPDTRSMVDADVLQALGPNGLFINVARGSIVDDVALIQALRSGTIAGAGLDVFNDQPIDGSRFEGLANVILTPHIGSATSDTRVAMANAVYGNVEALLHKRDLTDVAEAPPK
jgi:lactate dehydrogenase-like 2-hydroxyacid dehydrogenase